MKRLLLVLFTFVFLACDKQKTPKPVGVAENKINYSNVLILGNSITFHIADASLGWNNNHGMAASAPELDYVHLLTARLKKDKPSLQLKAYNIAKFENEYATYNFSEELNTYTATKPDLIILRLGENINEHTMDDKIFKEKYAQLIDYLRSDNPTADILTVSSFWQKDRTDNLMKEVTIHKNGYFISLGAVGNNITNTAWGLYANPAVGSHPGDKGMQVISDRIYTQIVAQSLLKKP